MTPRTVSGTPLLRPALPRGLSGDQPVASEQDANPEDAVLVERRNGVGIVTLNRADAMNAINMAVRGGLTAACRALEADPSVRAVLFRADGRRGFCVGADIKEFRPVDSPVAARRVDPAIAYIDAVAALTKPTVAAIHGFCLGGGFEIALACDLRIASADAVFGLPEINLGLIPGAGGTQRLPRLIGVGRALDLMLTGERFTAEEALRLGVISRLAPSQDALAEQSVALAETIAAKSPTAAAYVKEAVLAGADLDLKAGIALEKNLFTLLLSTEDRMEAAAAFREKRRPVFTGR
ncbi:enoyl-CoA hydratase/isomerase family protein [Azospirillum doebereinerae]|uniref:Enoyl-CoA hydratase/isomerase family protein n=1 Tax=Azospirillum doebereinerae TaxID=92933 RepID=A0A3S0V4B5_9PROT|nr:enoyl-CoA hydratase/isomerase family protein [Azospirillum doebereinerae]RUQ66829.1 enoyl-CoA hydratase/isomerase family protein [Azospirillum doebereinerae]